MKRLHVHVSVDDLPRSIGFYAALFGVAPSVVKPDYAKWMLDDPRVNFAISNRAHARGIDHLGIQAESPAELDEIAGRLKAAGETTRDQQNATCCYARSDKAWVKDPTGVEWETFYTFGDAVVYGEDDTPAATPKAACCNQAGESQQAQTCC